MNKLEVCFLIFIIVLAFSFRLFFWDDGKYGTDFFYHYTVTEQSLVNNKLSNSNNLSICYRGFHDGHVIGLYAIPYLLGKVFNLDLVFKFLPIILGIIGILLSYYLIKILFSSKIAMFTALISSLSLAHTTKTYPFTYRGEIIIYPILILSLIFLYKAFNSKNNIRWIYSILAGLVNGSSSFFWNGYPLAILIFLLSMCSYLLWDFIRNKVDSKKIILSGISVISQCLAIFIIFSMVKFYGKGYDFFIYYYPYIILLVLSYLTFLYLSRIYKNKIKLMISYGVFLLLSVLLLFNKLKVIFAGFGSINRFGSSTPSFEIYSPRVHEFYVFFFIIIITSIIGLALFLKKLDKNKMFYLGILLSSVYLLISASRYFYFSSIQIIFLTAYLFDRKFIIMKKFDLIKFLSILTIIGIFLFNFYSFPLFFGNRYSKVLEDGFMFIRENTDKESCIISTFDKGSSIEFFSKRHNYLNSLSYEEDRLKEAYGFYLSQNPPNFSQRNLYIFLTSDDITKVYDFAYYANISVQGTVLYKLFNNTYLNPLIGRVFHVFDNGTYLSAVRVEENGFSNVKSLYLNKTLEYKNNDGDGCLFYSGETLFYFNDVVCNSNIYKMITNKKVHGLEKIYDKNGIYIFKVLNSFERK